MTLPPGVYTSTTANNASKARLVITLDRYPPGQGESDIRVRAHVRIRTFILLHLPSLFFIEFNSNARCELGWNIHGNLRQYHDIVLPVHVAVGGGT